jgi:hypothetical protein
VSDPVLLLSVEDGLEKTCELSFRPWLKTTDEVRVGTPASTLLIRQGLRAGMGIRRDSELLAGLTIIGERGVELPKSTPVFESRQG